MTTSSWTVLTMPEGATSSGILSIAVCHAVFYSTSRLLVKLVIYERMCLNVGQFALEPN